MLSMAMICVILGATGLAFGLYSAISVQTGAIEGEDGDDGDDGLSGTKGEDAPVGEVGAVYRYAVFSTYSQASGWFANNDPDMFGGIAPSDWGDTVAHGMAYQMSSNKEILRTLFTKKGYGSNNSVVWAEEWDSYSSTNSRHALTLFRIKNPTTNAITWEVNVSLTCYPAWGERASISLNGADTWNDGSTPRYPNASPVNIGLLIPADRTSTVIFVSSSSPQGAGEMRSLYHAYTNDCLELPAGLEYVDDLDYATGGWEQ